ncbi:metal ABC transporter substrate-binding protein [Tumebacillus sp. DT12]|uniref:Metal ABC transporter substrate-binding protein n=1 Tax=Tumebacillus lacus TaxID=2995335 RepID=A0ABT3X2G1_9BACL|nr:metal ABC transporter substrate-binding protein [Tumebacillus lacus]MCX7571078.1 metal ABC transporter substrate-binding protein [Tumebacillus lacus]
MQKKWKLAVGSLAAASLLLTGCGDKLGTKEDKASGGQIRVVTTFYPMYEFTKQVGGDFVDATLLVPGGTEPHDWEPTAKDVARIADADLFVYNGAGFEGWVEDVLHNLEGAKVKPVEASAGIELIEGGHDHDEHEGEKKEEEHKEGEHKEEAHGEKGAHDPHVWTDPVLVQKEVENIAAALAELDQARAAEYKKNADAYLAKLKALDEKYKAELASSKSKEFVTAHESFAYLAKRYGLTQEPISGLSPEQEPSAAQMAEIVAWAKEHQVKTIFFETLVSPKVAEAVAREMGAKTAVLNPLEGLTEEEQAKGLDYIGVMEQNLEALKKALNE